MWEISVDSAWPALIGNLVVHWVSCLLSLILVVVSIPIFHGLVSVRPILVFLGIGVWRVILVLPPDSLMILLHLMHHLLHSSGLSLVLALDVAFNDTK